jgi:hypothetical protein
MVDQNEDVVDVIIRTALIENLLNQVIEQYCAPRSDRFAFFWSVLLDSSIMPIGSKAKVAMAVAQCVDFKVDKNAIHEVMALRNAFAHHQTDAHPVFVVGKTEVENSSHFELQIISSSGRITRTKRQDAFKQFNKAYTAAKASLIGLLQRIKSETPQNAA